MPLCHNIIYWDSSTHTQTQQVATFVSFDPYLKQRNDTVDVFNMIKIVLSAW